MLNTGRLSIDSSSIVSRRPKNSIVYHSRIGQCDMLRFFSLGNADWNWEMISDRGMKRRLKNRKTDGKASMNQISNLGKSHFLNALYLYQNQSDSGTQINSIFQVLEINYRQ